MLAGCIDIGSNTTRVLVADVDGGRLTQVLALREFTSIGRELRAAGRISPEKIDEVAGVVAAQARVAEETGVQASRAVATAAIRSAENGAELCAAVRAKAGIEVSVLDGVEEARLAFLGATRTMRSPPAGPIAVVDVGGGSSEVAVGTTANGVEWVASLRIGSGILADACLKADPPTDADLAEMRGRAMDAFANLSAPLTEAAVAVGGSATSLMRLVGPVLDYRTILRAVEVLAGSPSHEVAARYGLEPERVRLLPAGLVILAEAAEQLEQPLRIGSGGLREGVCLELAGQL